MDGLGSRIGSIKNYLSLILFGYKTPWKNFFRTRWVIGYQASEAYPDVLLLTVR